MLVGEREWPFFTWHQYLFGESGLWMLHRMINDAQLYISYSLPFHLSSSSFDWMGLVLGALPGVLKRQKYIKTKNDILVYVQRRKGTSPTVRSVRWKEIFFCKCWRLLVAAWMQISATLTLESGSTQRMSVSVTQPDSDFILVLEK